MEQSGKEFCSLIALDFPLIGLRLEGVTLLLKLLVGGGFGDCLISYRMNESGTLHQHLLDTRWGSQWFD
jgi:hypothetical protein